jgi:hypothetical protein
MAGHSAWIDPDIAVIAASDSHVRLAALRGVDAGAVGRVRGVIIYTILKKLLQKIIFDIY